MAESTIIKNMRDGTLTISVGASSYVIKYEGGNLTLQVPGPTVSNYLDRGKLADSLHGTPQLRYNEDQPMSGSFSAHLRDLSDATDVTLAEFLFKSGAYGSGWGSALGANAEVKTVNLQWDVAGLVHGDAADHSLLCAHAVLTGGIGEGDPNTLNVSFNSYDLYPTVT